MLSPGIAPPRHRPNIDSDRMTLELYRKRTGPIGSVSLDLRSSLSIQPSAEILRRTGVVVTPKSVVELGGPGNVSADHAGGELVFL
jgi:hypothetical protein